MESFSVISAINTFLNESNYSNRYSPVPLAILSLVFSVIITVTVIGNILVIVAYIRDSRIRANVANLFILNLSITDVLVGVFSLTFHLSRFIKGFWPHGEIICKLWSILDYTVVNVSWLTMILISWDRFCLVSMGLKYHTYQTKKRVGLILVFIWTIVVIYWSLIAFAWSPITGEYNVDYTTTCLMEYIYNSVAPIFLNLVYFCVSFVLLFLMNIAVYLKVRQRSKGTVGQSPQANQSAAILPQSHRGTQAIPHHGSHMHDSSLSHGERSAEGNSAYNYNVKVIARPTGSHLEGTHTVDSRRATQDKQNRKLITKHQKAAVILGILSGCFLLCWFPYISTSVVFSFCGDECIPDILWEITEVLAWCNSTINPFIYAATNVHFRKNFKKSLLLYRCTLNAMRQRED